jgi:hypothetical protein
MLSVNQTWDPLEVCIVGKMYDPKSFNFISSSRVRQVLEKIAIETEEDFQTLIKLLNKFNVELIRPNAKLIDNKLMPPPVTPRDHTAMIGNKFFIDPRVDLNFYQPIVDYVQQYNKINWVKNINTATILRLGKDLLYGQMNLSPSNVWTSIRKDNWPIDTPKNLEDSFNTKAIIDYQKSISTWFKDYRCHFYPKENHLDGCMAVIKPGLLISNKELDHKSRFKDWDILYLDTTVKDKMINNYSYMELRKKNRGKWWIPGEESNDDFIEFVDSYLSAWTGYIEESQFDLNLLMIDECNAVCTSANDMIQRKFDEYGINLHIVNFRHSLFFDGGIHCLTSDIKRKGELIDLALPQERNV